MKQPSATDHHPTHLLCYWPCCLLFSSHQSFTMTFTGHSSCFRDFPKQLRKNSYHYRDFHVYKLPLGRGPHKPFSAFHQFQWKKMVSRRVILFLISSSHSFLLLSKSKMSSSPLVPLFTHTSVGSQSSNACADSSFHGKTEQNKKVFTLHSHCSIPLTLLILKLSRPNAFVSLQLSETWFTL